MTAEDALRSSENSAMDNNQIVYSGGNNGGNNKKKSFFKKKGFTVLIVLTIILVPLLLLISLGNLIPRGFVESINRFMDSSKAGNDYSIMSFLIGTGLKKGTLGEGLIKRLGQNGMQVGYMDGGQFVGINFLENEKPDDMVSINEDMGELTASVDMNVLMGDGRSMVVKVDNRIITADEFPSVMMSDAKIMDIVNKSTYINVAGWYDQTFERTLSRNGVSRNNFKNGEFDTEMDKIVGKGSNITVEGISLVDTEETDEDGNAIQDYGTVGSIDSSSASGFISGVIEDSKSSSTSQATVDAATTLSTSQIIVNDNKSMKYAMGFLQPIDEMTAGYGNESQINEVMNTLTKSCESEVLDINSFEMTKKTGSILEAPSLYAILSGEKVDPKRVENYSSENIVKAMGNQGFSDSSSSGAFAGTLTSVGSKAKGLISRIKDFFSSDAEPDETALNKMEPVVDQSLVNNSFSDYQGEAGGQLLADGIYKLMAEQARGSGGTSGDREAVALYERQSEQVLALLDEADRMNRSPLDITSKNTFLGSILYKFALSSAKSGTLLNKLASVSRVAASSFSSMLPTTSADDGATESFGDCERFNKMYGAVASATCSQIMVFDTSTHSQIMDDNSTFYSVVRENVECDDNNICEIKEGSDFEMFAANYVNKLTPDGVTDAGIVESLANNKNGSSFIGNLVSSIKSFFGLDDEEKEIASGAAFINSSSNDKWEIFKYAQLYFSLVRDISNEKEMSGDPTMFSFIPYIGSNNPVLACLERLDQQESVIASE